MKGITSFAIATLLAAAEATTGVSFFCPDHLETCGESRIGNHHANINFSLHLVLGLREMLL